MAEPISRPFVLLLRRQVLVGLALLLAASLAMALWASARAERSARERLGFVTGQFDLQCAQVDGILKGAVIQVDALRQQMEDNLAQGGDVPPSVLPDLLRETPDGTRFHLDEAAKVFDTGLLANLTGEGRLSGRGPGFIREVQAALAVIPHLRLARQALPEAAWVYYTSASRFLCIHPWAASDNFRFTDEILTHEFFTLGLPETNPEGRPFWTSAYMDEYGKGLMVTYAAPVQDADRFAGTVSLDLTLDFLGALTRGFAPGDGVMFIVSGRGELLAHPVLSGTQDRRARPASEAFREALPGQPDFAPPEGGAEVRVRRAGSRLVLSRALWNAPWTVYSILPDPAAGSLGPLSGETVPVLALAVLALAVLLWWGRAARAGLAVPAEALAALFRLGPGDPVPDPPDRLPGLLRPLFTGVSGEALAARRRISDLARDRDQAKAMVASALFGMIQTTPEGRVLAVNPALAHLLGYGSAGDLMSVLSPGVRVLYADPARLEEFIGLLKRTDRVSGFEVWLRRRDGSLVQAALHARAGRTPDGRLELVDAAVEDLTERRAREEVQRKLAAAEASARAKSDFLAVMSHEIRTPLNTVLGMADLLAEDCGPGERGLRLAALRTSGEQLREVLGSVLDLAAMDAGKLALENEPFSPTDVVAQAAGNMAQAVGLKGLTLEVSGPPEASPARLGDPARVRQILLILLSNAVKFTPRGRVEVGVRLDPEDPGRLWFTVRDTGVGIPLHLQGVVFDRFVQAGSVARRQGGSGLGLAVARGLTEAMQGRLWMESQPGRGSAFHLVLPLPLCPETAPRIPARALSPAPASGPPAGPIRLDGLRVLLAEDNENNRMLADRYLSSAGAEVRMVPDGRQAVAAYEAWGADVVLMDLEMPEMDGFEAAAGIREVEQARGLSRVPMVALTAHALSGHREKSLAAGCDLFLTKPFRKEHLLSLLAELSGRAQAGTGAGGAGEGSSGPADPAGPLPGQGA